MSNLTERDLVLMAHYRFPKGVQELTDAANAWRSARTSYEACLRNVDKDTAVLARAQELGDALPREHRLLEHAQAQLEAAQTQAATLQRSLEALTGRLIDAAGEGIENVMAVLDAKDLTVESMLNGLLRRAGYDPQTLGPLQEVEEDV